MGKSQREKGKRGEREAAAKLRELGFPGARRGVQHAGGPDSPDIKGAIRDVHVEVKITEALSVYEAMAQAQADCLHIAPISETEEGNIDWRLHAQSEGQAIYRRTPVVMHKRNHKPWLVIVRADDLLDFCRRVLAAHQRPTINLPPETP